MLQLITNLAPRLSPKKGALKCASLSVMVPLVLFGVGGAASARIAGNAVIAEVGTFSGPEAGLGVVWPAACKTVTYEVNKAGGVDGHTLSCITVDTAGDPPDGVAAVRKMLASTPDLAGVLGPDGGTADAVVPILNAADVTMAAINGGSEFNKNHYQYYWRQVPSDSLQGTAMAVEAHNLGYTRAATIFTNATAPQEVVPPLLAAFHKLGGKITSNQAIVPGQSNYRTEVAKLLAGHPEVILMEVDAATAATLWLDIKQLEPTQIPIIFTGEAASLALKKAIDGSVGTAYVRRVLKVVNFYQPPLAQNPTAKLFNKLIYAKSLALPTPSQFIGDPYTQGFYNGLTIMALAMEEAHSVVPKVYNDYLARVIHPTAGARVVKVYSFAQGKVALSQHRVIEYIPTTGPVEFNRFHNTIANFTVEALNAKNVLVSTGRIITSTEIKAASS